MWTGIAIGVGIVVGVIGGIVLGVYLLIRYLASPKGFFHDLNTPRPPKKSWWNFGKKK